MIESSVITAKALLMTMLMSTGPVSDDRLNETYCMAQNIYYEARGESLKGKQAVGNVVYEARLWNGKVIRDMCQFAWYCDGLKDDPQLYYKVEPRRGKVIEPNMRDWVTSMQVAIKLMERNMWYRDPTRGATHYYNHNISTPSWSTVYPVTIVVENHTFLFRTD
jgi:spore germination cell wall hydrolase CwlJ-like protein